MWDKEKIMKAVDSFVQDTGRFPNISDFYERKELPSVNDIRHEWGTPTKFQQEMYEVYSQKSIPGVIEKEINSKTIRDFIEENDRLPYISEICGKELSTEIADKYVDAITDIYIKGNSPVRIISPKERERIISMIDEYVNKHNCLPKSVEFKAENGLVGYQTAVRHIGKITDFYKIRYPELYAQGIQETCEKREINRKTNGQVGTLTEENIKGAIDNFVKEHGRLPERSEFGADNGMPGLSTAYSTIGALGAYYAKAYPHLLQKSRDETIIASNENQEETEEEGLTMGM